MLLQVILICMFSMVVTLLILSWLYPPKEKIHQEENIIEHRKDNTTPMRNFEQIYNSIQLDLRSYGEPGSRCFTSYEELFAVRDVLFEKHEQLSRKDKLIVGSEWECVVPHKAESGWCLITTPCTITEIDDMFIHTESIILNRRFESFDFIEHFLMCWKPKEKTNE